MATQQNRNINRQPLDKAFGLFASCLMVTLGAWMGLRPETVLIRAVIVACVTTGFVRIVVYVLDSADLMNDD